VAAADALALQLSRLSRLDPAIPPALARPLPAPPAPPVSKLVLWRVVDSVDDLAVSTRSRLPAVPLSLAHGMRMYHATIQRGDVSLGLVIHLFADFPRSSSHITLEWIRPPPRVAAGPRGSPKALDALVQPAARRLASIHRAGAPDISLMQMEQELNRPAEPPLELLQSNGIYSLSFSVQRATTLLDVYIETEGEGGGATAIRGTLCSRRVRGRDRCRPFVYDRKSGQFDQSANLQDST
jgi:hypothetical protein